jgi:methylmalonyl-CoA mutase N-terminal domain/subunit
MRQRFGASDPRSMKMRFHAQTAGSSLTAQQPYVNVVRTTYEALAAVLGGAQSLHTNSFDEALALPTQEAARLALRTQQVIAHETGVAATADPVGGSYCIESLTDEIEDGARQYLERIEALGGTVAAIERGFIQREIQNSSYEFQKRVESGQQKLVGVNAFRVAEERPVPTLRIDAAAEKARCDQLRKFRESRDEKSVREALKRLEDAAASTENLMPAVLSAVENWATVGEISDALRGVYGAYNENVVC